MTTQPGRVRRGLASIAALVALFVGVPLGLVAVSRFRFASSNPLSDVDPPWSWDLGEIRNVLSRPLRDDAVVNLLIRVSLAAMWAVLAVVAFTIVVEVAHMLRHRGLPSPRVRGLGWAQGIARWVAIGLIALVPVNSFGSAATALPSDASPAATVSRLANSTVDAFAPMSVRHPSTSSSFDQEQQLGVEPHDAPIADSSGHHQQPTTSPTHRVMRGESIYSIADSYARAGAGDVMKVAEEILDLNLGGRMNDGQVFSNPALVQPGWDLTLPSGISGASASEPPGAADPTDVRDAEDAVRDETHTPHVVIEGDTLSTIADHHLGDADAWPQIWDENRGDDMGGGRSFDDPDLILPGWELKVATTSTEPVVESGVDAEPPVVPSTERASGNADGLPDVGSNATPHSPQAETEPRSDRTDISPHDVPDRPSVPSEIDNVATPPTSMAPAGVPDTAGGSDIDPGAPTAPSPIRLEHAALLSAGILTLVGVRRRRALRAALPHARVPGPPPDVAATERRLRTIDPGERAARIDVAVRAIAHQIVDTGARIGSLRIGRDGELSVRLTAEAALPAPWIGSGASWSLRAATPVELLSDDARQSGQPCIALVMVGIDDHGNDVLIDLEAAGLTTVEASPDQSDEIVRAIGSGVATSLDAEVAHLVVASLGDDCLFDHPNGRRAPSSSAALTAATALVGSTTAQQRSPFELRTRRTGGEMWEPAVVLFASDDRAIDEIADELSELDHGVAIVAACSSDAVDRHGLTPGARIVGHADGWHLQAFGEVVGIAPIGITTADVAAVADVLADAARPIESAAPVPVDLRTRSDVDESFVAVDHDIVVRLMGPVDVTTREGTVGSFERSKTVELIAWLATHPARRTRSAARTALWEMDVRDATFANVVSEARRALGRLTPAPGDDEWIARTLNDSLPLHDRVVTDAALIRHRVEHARLAPPAHAIDVLRPAVESIRGMPFASTAYLWPDADGITSNLVLLATTTAAELAGHALSLGDTDLVFWATGQGLQVLPGHEELIGLRMRAHARAGDLAGVRQEWESYERVITADSWSDGEAAPKLLDLRRELLSPSS